MLYTSVKRCELLIERALYKCLLLSLSLLSSSSFSWLKNGTNFHYWLTRIMKSSGILFFKSKVFLLYFFSWIGGWVDVAVCFRIDCLSSRPSLRPNSHLGEVPSRTWWSSSGLQLPPERKPICVCFVLRLHRWQIRGASRLTIATFHSIHNQFMPE